MLNSLVSQTILMYMMAIKTVNFCQSQTDLLCEHYHKLKSSICIQGQNISILSTTDTT